MARARRRLSPRGFAAVQMALAALLAACATTADRDGPPLKVPTGLENLRDAEPKVEAIRSGGPNSPYRVLGRDYVPLTRDVAFRQKGLASWYGRKFHGRPTASGETYDMFAMTAAHPTLPIPSYARIANPANGRSVVVRINDRGPFHDGRIVDLSYAAAWKLGVLGGVAPVALERITFSEIRDGAWRHRQGMGPREGDGVPLTWVQDASGQAMVRAMSAAGGQPVGSEATEAQATINRCS